MVTALQEALEFEGKEAALSIQDMMSEMIQNVEEGGGYVRQELDEFTIRKMLLARDYIKKDIDKMTEMKKAIVKEWDERIKKKKEEIKDIEKIVDNYIRYQNKGRTLSLDVATASLRKNPHRVKVVDENKVKEYFDKQGVLDNFLKDAPLDKTKSQQYFMKKFDEHVNRLAEVEIQKERKEVGKMTKKREKEILQEVIEKELPTFNEQLPEGFELQMPEERLTIRSNL